MTRQASGIIILNKPAGITSTGSVNALKPQIPRGVRIGHAGTLDPFATGVLLVLVGKATRWCETLMSAPKQYEATVKLGATTETDDLESPEEVLRDTGAITCEVIEKSLAGFTGEIEQVPPAYSALKIGGKRACDRVRAGQAVQLAPRRVAVYHMEILDFTNPLLRLRICCGRGTYIRSIARDLGASLGVGGYLTALCRTRVGEYDLSRSVTLDALKRDGIVPYLIPPPEV